MQSDACWTPLQCCWQPEGFQGQKADCQWKEGCAQPALSLQGLNYSQLSGLQGAIGHAVCNVLLSIGHASQCWRLIPKSFPAPQSMDRWLEPCQGSVSPALCFLVSHFRISWFSSALHSTLVVTLFSLSLNYSLKCTYISMFGFASLQRARRSKTSACPVGVQQAALEKNARYACCMC